MHAMGGRGAEGVAVVRSVPTRITGMGPAQRPPFSARRRRRTLPVLIGEGDWFAPSIGQRGRALSEERKSVEGGEGSHTMHANPEAPPIRGLGSAMCLVPYDDAEGDDAGRPWWGRALLSVDRQ